ncbi:unnamed protein product [Paramecium octaurelia]|uniref:Uncharacterized protein n=1 Tax=Paramecium octaurelia TaxID=43137 RepID=A0A8S1UP99_PAROT|nr:unnamed protein product [Paramecium octaurelia]
MATNNQANAIGQEAKRGKPPKRQGVSNPSNIVSDSNQPEIWYQSQEATEIIIILAAQGRILFQCLSGKKKKQISRITKPSSTKRSYSLTKFRNSRQDFVKHAETLQNQLLKKLEEHLEIELIGQQKQMDYFFFQDNKKTNLAQEPQMKVMKLLSPYIHKDFQETLITLLKLQHISKINQSIKGDLSNINKHKHFVSWAFIIAWGKKIRSHLTRLQQIRNDDELREASLLAKDLMDESKEILKQKTQEVEQEISQLINSYRQDYKEEIKIIINEFLYRNQQNNSEFEQNSYLEVY